MSNLNLPRAQDIADFHDERVAQADWTQAPARFTSGVWAAIEENHRCNTLLWDEESPARRRDVPDSAIAANKRAIDGYDQRRGDAVERIDEHLLSTMTSVARAADARLHSETAGAIIDRLSLLALKIHHMRLQTLRDDATPAHRETCVRKLARLREQRSDLVRCLGELFADALNGRVYFKAYRQFTMHNDPTLNPYLYGGK